MEDGVGQEVDGDGGMLARQVDVVNSAVESRVGVEVTAVRLDGRGDLAAGATPGALEQHVLKVM